MRGKFMNMMQNDYLMKQIDEIRDKAKNLQAKLISKEEELSELEIKASEKETEVKELEGRLDEQKKQAQAVVDSAKEEMTVYAAKLEGDIDELIKRVDSAVEEFKSVYESDSMEVRSRQEQFGEELTKMKDDLSDKTHSECIKVYRNLQSSIEDLTTVVKEKEPSDATVKKMKSSAASWGLFFGIINFLMIGGYILYDLGILSQLFGI
ncbi:MAG: hypothetical protein K6G40_03925 [Eubacterium sp.]|nr:hypothetical protein [Eubacterium sp.]